MSTVEIISMRKTLCLDEKLKNDTEKVEKVFTDDTGDNIRIIVNTGKPLHHIDWS
uniref:Uncharacterized protein n=1 Tax=Rhizophagus irregularis (strain DAOM 181602 / DAOM 197198 / MUCL 43194) TaxID=747089 RepID=U9U3A7_RHIID